jgi:glycosyltransferase involved in cell wall biosynthesis
MPSVVSAPAAAADTTAPAVSIVVPAHNAASYLVEALDSVHAQRYRPLELLVVDDGSTDGTGESARHWQQHSVGPGFSARVLHQPNRGAAAARNLGLREATGELVAFLDADDLYHPDFLPLMTDCLIRSAGADVAVCAIESFVGVPPGWSDPRRRAAPLRDGFRPMRDFWSTPNALYRVSYLRRAGGWNEALTLGWQDRELCLRLLLDGAAVCQSSAVLVRYRRDVPGSLSSRRHESAGTFFRQVAAAQFMLAIGAMRRAKSVCWAPRLMAGALWFAGRSVTALARGREAVNAATRGRS